MNKWFMIQSKSTKEGSQWRLANSNRYEVGRDALDAADYLRKEDYFADYRVIEVQLINIYEWESEDARI